MNALWSTRQATASATDDEAPSCARQPPPQRDARRGERDHARSPIATPNPSASACASQPVMIRLRIPSIRYETGLIVATVRNQSISIRFRGRFIDEMNRKTKKSGKSAWIASPEPVRSARNAPMRAEAERDQHAEEEEHERCRGRPLDPRRRRSGPTAR